jgi:hypothetical protein
MVSEPLTHNELDALEEAERSATPAPWQESQRYLSAVFHEVEGEVDVEGVAMSMGHADAVFIVLARSAVPALIAEVRRARAREVGKPIHFWSAAILGPMCNQGGIAPIVCTNFNDVTCRLCLGLEEQRREVGRKEGWR